MNVLTTFNGFDRLVEKKNACNISNLKDDV